MIILFLLAFPLTGLAVFGLMRITRRLPAACKARLFTGGLMGVNALLVVATALFLLFGAPVTAGAQEEDTGDSSEAQVQQGYTSGVAIGAALATGLAAIGAGIAVAVTGSAAIGGITQKPEILGRTLIFVGLAEGIAIYGLIISFMILTGAVGG